MTGVTKCVLQATDKILCAPMDERRLNSRKDYFHSSLEVAGSRWVVQGGKIKTPVLKMSSSHSYNAHP